MADGFFYIALVSRRVARLLAYVGPYPDCRALLDLLYDIGQIAGKLGEAVRSVPFLI